MFKKADTPWVEKYRPSQFGDIVLSPENALFFERLLALRYVPNMLFYGPPGTGKTTTVMNLVRAYQEPSSEDRKGLMIQLNASDDRGVDVIRSQINTFVTSMSVFGPGVKFVVLDEVDYMTKQAQQALIYVLNSHPQHVRFVLICNYISKVDETLQSLFVRVHFNHLPKDKVIGFLRNIVRSEGIATSERDLEKVQECYGSDLRAMINYLQRNIGTVVDMNVLGSDVWEDLYRRISEGEHITSLVQKVNALSLDYRTDPTLLLKQFVYYLAVNDPELLRPVADRLADAFHTTNDDAEILVPYVLVTLINGFIKT
jgi:replication-associated recombination protein RarA